MIKILYDHQCFTNQRYGGISRYFFELIKNLLIKKDVEINLSLKFSNNEYIGNLKDIIPFLPAKDFPGKIILLDFMNKPISIKTLRKNKYDIFHPTYYNPYFLSHLKSPFVLTIHDMIHELYPELVSKWDKSREHKKKLVSLAKKVICVSKNTKNDLVNLLDVDENKIEVIYHGISVKDYNLSKSLNNLILPEKFLLFVGKRSGYKNFNFTLKAISRLFKEDKTLHMVCYGGGKFSKAEIELFNKLNLSNNVHYITGGEETLVELYSKALAFIFPSLYEGFGIPILEAFACSCPVVCSDRSSLPEIAEKASEYFNPEDELSIENAVDYIIKNEKRRKELIELGKERLKLFDWNFTAEKTLEVYKSCL